ncbi:response regulator [Tamlana sp. 62-3]|uniref:Response regulator n=1 Tax=Neotamlana sargassicola TaxID=2883125 RepID=A0A9X1I8L0_9FLAO|nr:response regulator [Tamlana sargassicola]MCB4809277.1 response regulator [Tamlana sargassicola]
MKKTVNICIVDDDEIYQFTTLQALKKISVEKNIMAFYDGEEAYNFLINNIDDDSKLPDIIFLDINMPIMDGFQFMEEYVKIKPKVGKKILIYMVSSSVDPADIEKAKNIADISDYIIKPVKRGELQAIFLKLQREGKI